MSFKGEEYTKKEEWDAVCTYSMEEVYIVVTENPDGKIDQWNPARAFSSYEQAEMYKNKIQERYNVDGNIVRSIPQLNNTKIWTKEEALKGYNP